MAKNEKSEQKKVFVLDTSVILYDHSAIKNFEEHDVVIPIQVLEELDKFKKGNETRNYEAREFIRYIDSVSKDKLINDWIPINGASSGKFKVVMDGSKPKLDTERIFNSEKYDHKILNTAISVKEKNSNRQVVLVSKDISLRLKAKSVNMPAEDYETGKIKNLETLEKGKRVIDNIPAELIDQIFKTGSLSHQDLNIDQPEANQYFILRHQKKSVLAFYNPQSRLIEKIEKQVVYGIKPRNAEQTFTIHALMNPNVKLVTLQGVAGTGKTLLALACAMEQRQQYRQIFVSRPIVPLGNKDMGYLPGDIQSKLDPYMQPLWDNLKFIKEQFKRSDKKFTKIEEMVENEKISITPLAYIRGRSLAKVYFIVDEAQNLTPHEVKTIISRAGDDTKIIFNGDVHQIDTPYLDSQSNGLTYLIDKVKNNPLFAHIALEKGERSELANLANDLL